MRLGLRPEGRVPVLQGQPCPFVPLGLLPVPAVEGVAVSAVPREGKLSLLAYYCLHVVPSMSSPRVALDVVVVGGACRALVDVGLRREFVAPPAVPVADVGVVAEGHRVPVHTVIGLAGTLVRLPEGVGRLPAPPAGLLRQPLQSPVLHRLRA